MKSDMQSSYEVDGLEAPLPELARLRKTSRCEVPPAQLQAQVRGRLLTSVAQERRFTGRRPPLRPLLLAAVVLLGVPSAIAATGLGAAWVERVLSYLPVYSEDSAQPERELMAKAGAERPATQTGAAPAPSPLLDPVSELPGVTPEPSTAPEPSSRPSSPDVRASSAASPAPSAVKGAAPSPLSPARPRGAQARSSAAVWEPDPQSSSLHAERIVLEQARVRLNAADALGVLRLTDEHERRFPAGLLAQERARLRTQARALLGEINSEEVERHGNTE